MDTLRNSISTFAQTKQVTWNGYAKRQDEVGIERLYTLVVDTVNAVRDEGYHVTDDALHTAYDRMADIHRHSSVLHTDAIQTAVRAYVLRNLF